MLPQQAPGEPRNRDSR